MSSIIDRMREEYTGRNRPPRDKVLDVDMSGKETGRVRPMGFSVQEEHVLVLRVATTYWADANPECARRQRQCAETALLHELHKGVLHQLAAIRHGVMQDNKTQVLDACAALQKELGL